MKIKKLHPEAQIPTRAEVGSNGYDLYSVEEVFIPQGKTAVVDTGISIELTGESNYLNMLPYLEIKDRSGLASKGLRTGAGIVDYSYRGPVKVVIHNLNNIATYDPKTDKYGYLICKGDRIAQGIVHLSLIPKIEEVTELTETERNSGGFGSTGR
jgi:deoxyuridine 5'-triphosphate nucleotidohydrolase